MTVFPSLIDFQYYFITTTTNDYYYYYLPLKISHLIPQLIFFIFKIESFINCQYLV